METQNQPNSGSMTTQGTVKKVQKIDLHKDIRENLCIAEDGTEIGICISETLHFIEFPLKQTVKSHAHISKPFDNMEEVNITIKSFRAIPERIMEELHIIHLNKDILSFVSKIKYFFFHYYVVSSNYMNVDRCADPKSRLDGFLGLVKSRRNNSRAGYAPTRSFNTYD